jgi:CheY-like chemotaxis protein
MIVTSRLAVDIVRYLNRRSRGVPHHWVTLTEIAGHVYGLQDITFGQAVDLARIRGWIIVEGQFPSRRACLTKAGCSLVLTLGTSPDSNATTQAAQMRGGRVLVCEDNVLHAAAMCEFLHACGLEPVGPAGRLESAQHYARVHSLDGAILDINLRGQLCFPLCATLSAWHVPFVFLTEYGDPTKSLIPMEYRGAPIILKPFEPNEMKQVLCHMLALSPFNSSQPPLLH